MRPNLNLFEQVPPRAPATWRTALPHHLTFVCGNRNGKVETHQREDVVHDVGNYADPKQNVNRDKGFCISKWEITIA